MVRTYVGVQIVNGYDSFSETYYFNCYEHISLGDMVVVDTKYGFRTGKIVEILDEIPSSIKEMGGKILKEVVCRIDFEAFNERKAKRERAEALKAKMDVRVKELQEIAVFEMLSEKDDDLKALLQEYKTLI